MGLSVKGKIYIIIAIIVVWIIFILVYYLYSKPECPMPTWTVGKNATKVDLRFHFLFLSMVVTAAGTIILIPFWKEKSKFIGVN
jgi:hypothetical protein